MALHSCRSCFGALQRGLKQSISRSQGLGKVSGMASSVATTSRITLSCPQYSTLSTSPSSLYRSSVRRSAWNNTAASYQQTKNRVMSRGMATITRQPESPEEPAVFSGGEAPSIILTDRAIQVSIAPFTVNEDIKD